ncbi:MAG TPA: PHB depolymerase family esterase, partial [Longimicrobium sp.]|nr:PHB depolymerase family esterase [Longimicrobium sp.]
CDASTPAPASAASADAPPARTSAPTRPGTFEWHTYTGDGGTRRYKLFVPGSYDRSRPAPLVVMLHGCTQDPDDFARGTRFNQVADSAGVLVAYPEQTAAENPQKCWSWWDPAHQRAGSGQAAQIAGITREVMARHAVDPSRVYVAGISAGGAMAVNVAVSFPTLYAAVGVHSGIAYGAARDVPSALAAMRAPAADPDPAADDAVTQALRARGTPLPLIAYHGEADAVVNVRNAAGLAGQWMLAHDRAFPGREMATFVKHVRERFEVVGGLEIRQVHDYPRIPVLATTVGELGHAWSGGSPEGTYTDPRGPDASREMLRFFLANPMR